MQSQWCPYSGETPLRGPVYVGICTKLPLKCLFNRDILCCLSDGSNKRSQCIYIIIVVDLSNPIVKIPRVVVSCVLLLAVIKDSWQELTSLLS